MTTNFITFNANKMIDKEAFTSLIFNAQLELKIKLHFIMVKRKGSKTYDFIYDNDSTTATADFSDMSFTELFGFAGDIEEIRYALICASGREYVVTVVNKTIQITKAKMYTMSDEIKSSDLKYICSISEYILYWLD